MVSSGTAGTAGTAGTLVHLTTLLSVGVPVVPARRTRCLRAGMKALIGHLRASTTAN